MTTLENIKKIVTEAIGQAVWEAQCTLHTARTENLTEILTQIRAIRGVTIVNLVEASKKVTQNKEVSQIKVKFVPIGGSVPQYLKWLKNKVRNTSGVLSFIVKEVVDVEKELKKKRDRTAKKKKLQPLTYNK
tara:strand:+ start:608 stop:1003 length:396 start_codon:yes stop_codon:yes gene_type:complete